MEQQALRETLARALAWTEAHVSFTQAADVPVALRGTTPQGFAYSPWQLLEHIRIALEDLVAFATSADYTHVRAWPDDYWPREAAPPDGDAWDRSVDAVRSALARMQQLATDPDVDLLAPVPTGRTGQTYLRALLLVLDHNAYHVGQLVALRRALGAWD
jgi:hypothetical protein